MKSIFRPLFPLQFWPNSQSPSISRIYLYALAAGLFIYDNVLAQSDAQLQKSRPLYEAAVEAEDSGRYLEAAENYQKVWDILSDESTTALRFMLINVARRSVDWNAIEHGGVPSERVILMLKRCPSPVNQFDASDEDFGLEQMQYGLMQIALCQHANSVRDYDSAEVYLSRAEVFIDTGSQKARSIANEMRGILDTLRNQMASARVVITNNRGTDSFYRTLGLIKAFVGDGGSGRSGMIRCPHCRKGDIFYERENVLGHRVWDSKPCRECHGTGWIMGVRP